eukprot:TRINITY_DN4046_c0_g2_i1.p1 TRINITY_DN4046_c0_g2~~TRINITY_DN4046_c0_g2_i1.p1  ORF type:complete len:124 (+),score=9.97 TRINITY_DN4046_c0_g2_i1:271-642(+)
MVFFLIFLEKNQFFFFTAKAFMMGQQKNFLYILQTLSFQFLSFINELQFPQKFSLETSPNFKADKAFLSVFVSGFLFQVCLRRIFKRSVCCILYIFQNQQNIGNLFNQFIFIFQFCFVYDERV